ncbi:MAG TPA: 50S ribosomal protein L28 [Oligoflexia bacterium]|nr:50S ribosomal protein L28 [Oligoflexia bacterium]HMP27518.1 50S ribosomal protein L28 [Oligoflexia bacterium]
MSHKCQLTGVSNQNGHRVSHANNKTHHRFYANLQNKRIYVPELKKFLTLKLSTSAIRTIDKLGFNAAIKKYGKSLKKLSSKAK